MPSFALYCKLKSTEMLLLLTVFKIKTCLKAFKERFLSELLFINFGINFIFTPDKYIGSKYRLSVYLICNNRIGIGPEKHISVDP